MIFDIERIKCGSGQWLMEKDDLLLKHFLNLFTTFGLSYPNNLDEENELLTQIPTPDEMNEPFCLF